MADLKASQADMEERDKWITAESAVATETEPVFSQSSDKDGGNKVAACKREASLEKTLSQDLGKGWKTDLAEKEKLLKECKNQIRVRRVHVNYIPVEILCMCIACMYLYTVCTLIL